MWWIIFIPLLLASHVKIHLINDNHLIQTVNCYEYYGLITQEFSRFLFPKEYSIMKIDTNKSISYGNCYFQVDKCQNILEIIWLRDDLLNWEFYGFSNDICWDGMVLYPEPGLGKIYLF